MDDQAEAQRAFIDASRDVPDDVGRCAAAGECASGMTQNEARTLIPLPDDAFAGAEAMRRGQQVQDPPPSRKNGHHTQAHRQTSGQTGRQTARY